MSSLPLPRVRTTTDGGKELPRLFQQSEATSAQRRFPVYLVDATDGITPETGENGEQPQISKNGGSFGNTSAVLVAVSNGHYYVELTAAELDTAGYIAVRFKSANTAEFNMDGQVIGLDIYDATGSGLTAVPWNSAWDAEVQSECADALSAYDPPTKAEMDSAHSTTDGKIDTVDTVVDAILVDTGTSLPSTLSTIDSEIGTIDGIVDSILVDTNELQTDDVPGLIATLDAVVDTVKAETALIVADTNELQSDDVPGLIATLDAVVDTVKAETALIVADTNELQSDDIPGSLSTLSGKVDTVDGIVDAILVDTAVIGSAGAGLTAVPWNAAWDAEVQSECNDALVALNLDHLMAVADADDVVNNSALAKIVSKTATADWSTFTHTTDSLEAIGDELVGTDITKLLTLLQARANV